MVKWIKILPGVIALVVLTALIAVLMLRSTVSDDEGKIAETPAAEPTQVIAPRPEPIIPGGAPFFFADKVSLAEARKRAPFTIPIPEAVGEEGLRQVWVSSEEVTRPRRSVALHFADGLQINLDGPVPQSGYGDMIDDPPFKAIRVNGHAARGANPGFSEGFTGKEPYPGSVSWWVNEVQISIYHPTLSMEEILLIAESMPEPAWKSGTR